MKSQFANAVNCHSWNEDNTRVALCQNDKALHIYGVEPGKPWESQHVLQLHDKRIAGIAWCHSTGKIATCSHDGNAYVLSFEAGGWKKELVRLLYATHSS